MVTSHGTDIIGLQNGTRFNQRAEYVVKRAKKIIAVSSENSEYIKKCFPTAKPVVIQAGYDTKVFNIQEYDKAEILNKYGIEYKGQKIILFAGRLSHLKGVDILLNAAKLYEKKGYTTIIAGNGALRKELKALAKKIEVKDVYFIGHKSQRTLKKLYNIADVFAMPSRMEAFGLVAVEALACGLPVVCTKTGGMKEYINNKVGKLVEGENPEELAKALISVINNKEKYKKEELSNYAKENFAQEKSMEKLIEIYNEAIKEERL